MNTFHWEAASALQKWLIVLANSHPGSPLLQQFSEFYPNAATVPDEDHWLQLSPWSFFEDNYKPILRNIPLRKWDQVLDELPDEFIPFAKRELYLIRDLSRLWGNLEGNKRARRLEAIEPLVVLLARAWNWKVIKRESIGNELVVSVQPETTHLKLPPLLPVIVTFVFAREGSSDTAYRWTDDLWKRVSSGNHGGAEIALNIVVGQSTQALLYSDRIAKRREILTIDELKLKDIFTSERYSAKLQKIIKKSLGLGRLNPYNSEKPVDNVDMFYGRESEVRHVLADTRRDFIIVGARKIGKSSLLKCLERTTSGSESRKAVFLDCSEIADATAFAERLTALINPRRRKGILPQHLPQMVAAVRSTLNVPFLILVDEADKLVQCSSGSGDWSAFSALREISNRGSGQTVITGYREVYRAWQDLKSPLFNFVQPIYLSVLSEQSARKLVMSPMADLGVRFENQKLVQQIARDTGRHPSLLQFFCSSLIQLLDETGRTGVRSQELQLVREMRQYLEFVVKPFRRDGNLENDLERWLVLRLVQGKQDSFSAGSLVAAFGDSVKSWLSVSHLTEALEGLELSGLIRRTSGSVAKREDNESEIRYQWTIPAFPMALVMTENVDARERELRGALEDHG